MLVRRILAVVIASAGAALACSASAQAATITVTTDVDGAPADECTLREAINAANNSGPTGTCALGSTAEADQIILGPRRLTLSIQGSSENANAKGDVDINSSVELIGSGASLTTIDATELEDRAIEVRAGGEVTVRGVTVKGGRSPPGPPGIDGADGGGIFNDGGLVVENSRLTDNETGNGGISPNPGDGGDGGAIYSTGKLTIANSVIDHNKTGVGGSGGGSGGNGGGIATTGNDDTVTNSTIAANEAAGSGGGIASAAGGLTLLHTTLASGSDVRVTAGSTTIQDSIVGACAGAVTDGGGNVTTGSCPGTAGDPRLGGLGDNGGPTPTMALGPGSAAIDRIPANAGLCAVNSDQRGTVARPQGPGCDSGAFEVVVPPTIQQVAAGRPAGPDETAPKTDQVAVDPRTFAVAATPTPLDGTAARAARGTTIRYRLSEPASALLSIERQTKGLKLRRGGKRGRVRCLKATRRNRRALVKQLRRKLRGRALSRRVRKSRCTLFVVQGVLQRVSHAGTNRVAFSGRIGRRGLPRGRYRVSIVATDASDNRSKPARSPFRIVAAR